MLIGIVEFATGALRSVAKAFGEKYNLVLSDIPTIQKEPVIINRVKTPDNGCASMVKMKHPTLQATGFLITYIPFANVKQILMDLGMIADPTDQDVSEACGELASMIGSHFKIEMARMGFGEMVIGAPRAYAKGMDEEITGVYVDYKYRLSFAHNKNHLMDVDLAYETKQEAKKEPAA